jgi:hypothetical protein
MEPTISANASQYIHSDDANTPPRPKVMYSQKGFHLRASRQADSPGHVAAT